jgi:4-amino-4-deoxy-L-arabinose transferase-like glycosyltransferase
MFCPKCGKGINEVGRFCKWCGVEVREFLSGRGEIKEKVGIRKSIGKLKGKNRFWGWVLEPYNFALVCILLFAFGIRLYYFNINEAIWWDEGQYLSMAQIFAGITNNDLPILRPPLIPLIWAGLYKMGLGNEFVFRLTELLFSIAGVFLTYLIGKSLYNKNIGIIASFLMSVFWMHLFYSARLLVGIPSLTILLLAVYYFWKGYMIKEKPTYIWLLGASIGLGILVRFPGGIILPIILIFLIIKEKITFIKDKQLWISFTMLILTLSPYLIWSYIKYSDPFFPFTAGVKGIVREQVSGYGHGMFDYLKLFLPHYLHTIFFVLLLIGLVILIIDFIIKMDLILKRKINNSWNDIFIILWISLPLIYFGFFIPNNEDRFLFYIFPAVFIIIAKGSLNIYNVIKKFNKTIAVITMILILLIGAGEQLVYAEKIIKHKANSFTHVKEVGLWLKEHSKKEDIIFNSYQPINAYYSERLTYNYPDTEEMFQKQVHEFKPKYMVLFGEHLSKNPWLNHYPQKYNLTLAEVFYFDKEKKQVSAVIYEFQ